MTAAATSTSQARAPSRSSRRHAMRVEALGNRKRVAAGRSASSRRISPIRKGLPPVAWRSRRTRPGSAAAGSRVATNCAVWASSKPVSVTRSSTSSRRSSMTSSASPRAGAGSPARYVASTASGDRRAARRTWRSRSSVRSSAQCRSSRTSSSGPPRASASTTAARASKSRSDGGAISGASPRSPGTTSATAAISGASRSRWSASLGRTAAESRSASTNGWNGIGAPSSVRP